jgi:hypothetical protein
MIFCWWCTMTGTDQIMRGGIAVHLSIDSAALPGPTGVAGQPASQRLDSAIPHHDAGRR